MTGPWPLIGRDQELAAAADALARRHVVVLLGEAGVGKTRIATAVAELGTGRSRTVRRVVGRIATRDLPLAAIGEFIGAAAPHLAASALMETVLQTVPGRARPLLFVDDAQWLDSGSAGILQQVIEADRLDVVITVRTGEAVAASASVSALWTDPTTPRIVVSPLSDRATTQLINEVLGGPVEARTLLQLTRISRGNALFLRELVDGALAGGALWCENGLWRFISPLVHTPVLEQLILSRYAPLDAAGREAIELVAIAGGVPVRLLETLAPPAVLEELERKAMLTAAGGGDSPLTVELAHPLHGEIIRNRMPALTKLRLSRLLADAATAVPGAMVDELQVVVWERDGGGQPDLARLIRAARSALVRNDTGLAGSLAITAVKAAPTFEAASLAAWCLAEQGDHAGALDIAQRTLDQLDDPSERAGLVLRIAEERYWGEGLDGDTDGHQTLADATNTFPPGPWLDLFRAQTFVFAMLDGAIGDALPGALALVDHPDQRVASVAALAAEFALSFSDRGSEAIELAGHAYAATRDAPYAGDPNVHVLGQVLAMAVDGQYLMAEEMIALVHEVAVSRPGRQAQAWAAVVRAFVALRRGRLDSALRLALEAEMLWLDQGLPRLARWAGAAAVQSLAEQGRVHEAREVEARMALYPAEKFRLFEPLLHRASAFTAAVEGRTTIAVAELTSIAEQCLRKGSYAFAMIVIHDLTRIGEGAHAARLVGRVPPGGTATEATRAHVLAAAAADPAAMAEAAEALAVIGADLAAAEAFAQAAELWRRHKSPKAATRCAARSADLQAQCERARTPGLLGSEKAMGLSKREIEVARLAQSGASNREIAEELNISERTVENHLYRAFSKFGVTSRADLSSVLGPRIHPETE